MPWQLWLALFFIFRPTVFILQRVFAQQTSLPPSIPPALSKVLAITPLGLLVGFGLPHTIHWSWWLVYLLAVESIGIGIASKLGFTASKGLSVGEFQILNQLYIVVVVVLGWLLLSEKLNVPQIIGAVFLLGSAILAARAPKQQRVSMSPHHHSQLILLAIIAAIALGIGLVGEKAALHYMDLGGYFIVGFGAQTLVSILIAIPDLKREVIQQITRKDLANSALWGSAITLGGFTYLFAVVKSNNVSLIVALTAFVLPLSVLAAYFGLHERENMRTLGTAVALGCLGLVISAL